MSTLTLAHFSPILAMCDVSKELSVHYVVKVRPLFLRERKLDTFSYNVLDLSVSSRQGRDRLMKATNFH